MDLLESETDALEKKTTAAYDTEGNLTELTDRRGKLDKFTYDALNRLTEAKYGVSGETAESTIKYEYDNGNRLTKVDRQHQRHLHLRIRRTEPPEVPRNPTGHHQIRI